MSSKYEPCPMCGSENVTYQNYYTAGYYIYCKDCGTRTRQFPHIDPLVEWNLLTGKKFKTRIAELEAENERLKKPKLWNCLRWFAGRMQHKLNQNRHKGGWAGQYGYLLEKLNEERKEVDGYRWLSITSMTSQQKVELINELADEANVCMMLADVLKQEGAGE